MDRSNQVTLIKKTYTQDVIGQQIATEVLTTVFCKVTSVSRDEFFTASNQGLKPQFQITINRYEYDGQNEVELDGIRYGVYRTYIGKGENLYLYIESKKGI